MKDDKAPVLASISDKQLYLYSKDVELSRFQIFLVPETVSVNYQDFYTLLNSL